jgi:hypothetical protein
VETVHEECVKFEDRPAEMLSASEGSEGGERETFLIGSPSDDIVVKRMRSDWSWLLTVGGSC